jgi:hypothetical protein
VLWSAADWNPGRDGDADPEWIADEDSRFEQDTNPVADTSLFALGHLDATRYR